jgi:diaminohydroxyphosphoribosylaminopyrimidine deaminase/5-amino-6-(5-phosphoribosylamino)uracil reductase
VAGSDDLGFMAEAIAVGRQHLGQAWPNPSVGAVVVKDGRILGRGVTAIGGRPHAEPQALAEAGDAARGATLYVTLEPCSHHGKTPPCAEAVIAAGIARVVIACDDPDLRVAGRGVAMLRAAGIEVETGVMAEAAWAGLRPHLTRIQLGRPFVTLKMAVSADGMIGRRDRGNVAITGEEVRAFVHRMRSESDAIGVGIGTALLDDPRLDVRIAGLEHRSPVRVAFDRMARLPVTARMLAGGPPAWVTAGRDADPVRLAALEAAGARTIPAGDQPVTALKALAEAGVGSLMLEGGAALAEAFLADDLVDELVVARSSVLIGADGVPAPHLLMADPPQSRWRRTAFHEMGDDTISIFLRTREGFPCSPASSPTSVPSSPSPSARPASV